MDANPHIGEFERLYLAALEGIDPRLPIVSSIGLQSVGKSYFLGRVFNDSEIPNKDGQLVTKGTNVLYSKKFNDFLLFDMEGTGGRIEDQPSTQRDILNFAATFAITNILLLQILELSLENNDYLESFSYAFWHSSKISSKYKIDSPYTILLIRDPRNRHANVTTIAYYDERVREFERNVNTKVQQLEEAYMKRVEDVMSEPNIAGNEETKISKELINNIKKNPNLLTFKIHNHFCVYHNAGMGVNKIDKYYQMKITAQKVILEKSSFEVLRSLISIYSGSTTRRDETEHGLELLIDKQISSSASISRKAIFQNILNELKYNVFSRFRTVEEYLRYLEPLNRCLVKLVQLDFNIQEEIQSVSEDQLTLTTKNLKQRHQTDLQTIIDEEFRNYDLKYLAMPYLKYQSVGFFCKTFQLNKGECNTFPYQALDALINVNSPNNEEHFLGIIKKNINIFMCQAYYDEEFESMASSMLTCKFKLYETIFSIYKARWENFINAKHNFKEDLDKEYKDNEEENHLEFIEKLVVLLRQVNQFPIIQLKEFLINIKELYKIKLTQKMEGLPDRPRDIQTKREIIVKNIYSYTLYQRALPSIFGLMIGMSTTVIRQLLISAATKTAATGASWLLIPYVGWAIAGASFIGNAVWAASSTANSTKKESVKFEFSPQQGYSINSCEIRVTQINGKLEKIRIYDKPDRYSYSAEFTADITQPISAFLSIEFVINYSNNDEIVTVFRKERASRKDSPEMKKIRKIENE